MTGRLPKYEPFEKSEDLAFLIGLALGDGYIGNTSRTQVLKLTLGTDKPLLWQYAAEIVKKIFEKEPHLCFRKSSACVDICIYQNKIDERLGILSGSKKETNIKLPDWAWKKKSFLRAILKGLFEAEGSFSIHEPTYTYNFSFSNRNQSLLNEVEKVLIQFGYHPERRKYQVRLRKKKETLDFEKFISFRNYS